VAAVGLSGAVGPFSKSATVTVPSGTQRSKASFLGVDATTEGNWPGTYGKDGFYMPSYFYGRDCEALPDYLCAVERNGFTNRQFSIWSNARKSSLWTSPISYCARYLGALETGGADSLALDVSDTRPHQLALYVCDFDKKGREETIEILDREGHVLVPARTVSDFEQGKWLKFEFSGSIQVRLTNRSSHSTAVLSALMFDQAP
jgi:hypothetical protein